MPLSAGVRLGPYEILSAIGAGGMGEVYRSRDTKLNRDVAVKVLPELFANDPERLARFRREAQMLAALNHPNIAHIHGFEDSGGIHALVMELVDGPTLAERIALGSIPLTEALTIATQIAQALDAAHEQGIVHRDLKPANVKVRDDGTVKVLDFGLARLVAPESNVAGTGPALTQSPTLTTPAATLAGVILGTAAYMSPEQAKGRTADKRSDVWAFGAVLYEMLTGRRPFAGEDLSDTLASVLKSEPDWSALPAEVPPHIRLLIQRCLAKDRRQRTADISIALFVMTEVASLVPAGAVGSGPVVGSGRTTLWRQLAMAAVAAIVVGIAAGTAVWVAFRPTTARVTRFEIPQTGAGALSIDLQSRDVAIAPDGRSIVYKGTGTTATQLYVRALDRLEPTVLANATGTSGPGARAPFVSRDGQWIGFVDVAASVTLKKVAITGGPALPLCRLDGASRGATWGDDDTIILATAALGTGLQRVSSAGGEPTVLTKPNPEQGEGDHLWPQFLPGSKAVLFTITATTGGIDASQVAVLDLRTGTRKILMRGGSQAQYVRSGHLVYVAAGTLRAVAFDLDRLETIGPAIPVVPQVVTMPSGTAEFDIATDGTLVYASGGTGAAPARTLVWVDRQGREEAVKGAPLRAYAVPRLSPDGTRVALEIRDQENDIWVWDLGHETLTRVTFDPGLDRAPVWMPDGRRLVFSSQAGGATGALFWQAADGTGRAERLAPGTNVQIPTAVSRDGTRIVFMEAFAATRADVMALRLDKDHTIRPLVQTPYVEQNGEISSDGRWLAYQSTDSGQDQIFVRPFPDVTSGLWQVSTGGGTRPLWSWNGQELFYIAPNGALMSVRVGRGETWTAGAPTKAIEASYLVETGIGARSYDVSADGKRFLMIKQGGAAGQTGSEAKLIVVQNWLEELKQLVPTAR
jgi:Tol biopolymer transport system component